MTRRVSHEDLDALIVLYSAPPAHKREHGIYAGDLVEDLRDAHARIAALEAELEEARKDGERLDALEALAGDNRGGGLLLHHQLGAHVKWGGLRVGLSHRSLRKAIDDFRCAK